MQLNEKLSFKKGISVLEIFISVIVLSTVIFIIFNFMTNKNQEIAVGKDVVRCIIDENASNLNSPACKRVINHCSNSNIRSCKKLLFYTDDGIHSNEALSILGNICAKGGASACDVLINRCIEDSSNCEVIGKSYDIKSYLAMKASTKTSSEAIMLKKLKTYYDKDVDNIVSSVINTCMSDKSSMACKIFTSKVYRFNLSEKPYFILNSNSNNEIEFSKIGISLLKTTETASTELKKNNKEENIYNINNVNSDKNDIKNETSLEKVNIEEKKEIIDSEKDKISNEQEVDNSSKIQDELSSKPVLINLNKDVSNENTNLPKKATNEVPEATIIKASLTTGEDNNIDYIKDKIYSFEINYKEPENTKIRWLVSFDDRATWKRWDGKSWIQIDVPSDIETIDFSKIGNTCAEIEQGLNNYTMQPGEISLDFAVELMSTDKEVTPAVNKVEIRHY